MLSKNKYVGFCLHFSVTLLSFLLELHHSFVKSDLPPSWHTRHMINQHSPMLLCYSSFNTISIQSIHMEAIQTWWLYIVNSIYHILYRWRHWLHQVWVFHTARTFFHDCFKWACCVLLFSNIYIFIECVLS